MKIEKKSEYPPEIAVIIDDYNNGVDHKDITEVDMAVTALITNVFSPNPDFRKAGVDALAQVGNVQPGFLKNGARVLLSRYKQGGEKAEFASIALYAAVFATKARPLIVEADIVQKLTEEENTRTAAQRAEKQIQTQFLEKVKTVGVDLNGLSGSIFQVGNYYNKCLVDDNFEAAMGAVNKLIDEAIASYPENFIHACLLLGRIANESNRKEFFKKNLNYLLEKSRSKKKEIGPVAEEMLESIIAHVADLVPADLAGKIQAQAAKKAEERKKESAEKAAREKAISKGSIEVDHKWEAEVRDLAAEYNTALAANAEKGINAAINVLEKLLGDKSEKIRLGAAQILRQLVLKHKELVQKILERLIKTCRKADSSEILGEMLDVIQTQNLVSPETLAALAEDKSTRYAEKEKRRQEEQKRFEEIERVSIRFDSEWDERLVKLCESFNDHMLNKREKDSQKVVNELEKYLYAEDKAIRYQTAQAVRNVADKYPDFLTEGLRKLIGLFESKHELREFASEGLAIIIQSTNKDKIFKDVKKETLDQIYAEHEERIKKADDQALQDKWQSIRMDVVPVPIKDEWKKNIQELVRHYNEAIKNQDKEKVGAEVKTVVDGVLNEKKDDVLQQWIEVLGGIAEKNIELIAPTINLLLQWAGEKDENKKFRAIQGLGEVAVARPGWAYQAIETIFKVATSDENEAARMKAFLQVSRIAGKEVTMVMEHIEEIIKALKDPNKQIRRLAAWTLGQMAERIPLEAKEAIPALTDALHDEYPLVRTFADKALNLIRQAMRKEQ